MMALRCRNCGQEVQAGRHDCPMVWPRIEQREDSPYHRHPSEAVSIALSAGSAMTLDDVREALSNIEAAKGDPEISHGLADNLYCRVLEAVAEGDPNARELAREALKVETMDLRWWYA